MIEKLTPGFLKHEQVINRLAGSGYVIAYDTEPEPSMFRSTYADKWGALYVQNGLRSDDPTLAWGYAEEGIIRWSDIPNEYFITANSSEFMKLAASYGLAYGLTYSSVLDQNDEGPIRCFCAAARRDTEFSDDEVEIVREEFFAILTKLHLALGHVPPEQYGVRQND